MILFGKIFCVEIKGMAEPRCSVDVRDAVAVIFFIEFDMKSILAVADFVKFTAVDEVVVNGAVCKGGFSAK